MVFDCLWVVVDVFELVVEFFEVVVDGCRSFLLLVTTLGTKEQERDMKNRLVKVQILYYN